MNKLDQLKDKIDAQYAIWDSKCKLGWSFLYTGPETYSPEQKFIFVGLNPGGGKKDEKHKNGGYECGISCEENSSAYLDQKWGYEEGEAPFQIQMQKFFKELCHELSEADCEGFMRNTMCANYIPFRSKNWKQLEQKPEILKFAAEMWAEILDYIQPSAILTIDNQTYNAFKKILNDSAWQRLEDESDYGKIGWGNNNFYYDTYEMQGRRIVLAKFPHLSSRKIFSREHCEQPRSLVIKKIANAIQTY